MMRTAKKLLALSVFAISFGGVASANPSFDCRKASVSAEYAICGSSELSRLDVELSRAYKSARSALSQSQKKQLSASQKNWLQRRNRCGSNASCLEASMASRIRELGGRGSRGAAAAAPRPSSTACNHVYAGKYFRISQKKINNAKDLLGGILFGATMGIHFYVTGVNPRAGVATACSSDSGKCLEFTCTNIP